MHPLLEYLKSKKDQLSPLLVLTHNHPDPDSISSAWALSFLAERLHGIRCRMVYGGIIGRRENQMMVRILKVPLYPAKAEEIERAANVAVVDSQPPFQNNPLSPQRKAQIVIDHHPRHAKTDAELVLIDEKAGATATLLAEALLESRLEILTPLATALVYGVGSETQNLGREAGPRDVAVYRNLLTAASMKALAQIQNPTRPRSFFTTLGRAIRQAFVVQQVIGVHLGAVPSQDMVSHVADFLLTHEKIRWSIVTGRYEGFLFVSLRTRNTRAEAGRLIWRLLGTGGSAGGHGMIAGGSILVGKEVSEETWRKAEAKLAADFLRSLGYKEPCAFEYPFR